MVHQERLEIGEKCFVTGIMAVLATEAALTVIASGMHFSWPGVLLGVVGFCLILFLANRLYAGDRQAHKIALAWVAFQIVYAGFALYLLGSSAQGVEMARQIGAPAAWTVILKALVYLSLGWILLYMPTVREFFAVKRGEQHHDVFAQKVVVAEQSSGPALPFTADQNEAVRGLAQFLRLSVAALIFLGFLQIVVSVVAFPLRLDRPQGLLLLVQGLLTVVLGIALGAPSNEVRPLTEPEEQSTGQLMNALSSLAKFYRVQILVGLLLAAVAIARFVFILR